MLFWLSKLFAILVTPSDVAVIALGVAAILVLRGRETIAWRIVLGVIGFCIVFGFGPGGVWLARPLEDRFTPARAFVPDNIVVLGAGIDPLVTASRRSFALNDEGSRLTEAVILARRFRNARLIYTGGSGRVFGEKLDEATAARGFWLAMGVPASRIVIETRSRTTYENARNLRAMATPQGHWLLVTSALHMPRAMGVFRRQGFAIAPWPVAYHTSGRMSELFEFTDAVSDGLRLTDLAFHEWLGLVFYRLAGKTDALLPAPR